MLSLVLCLLLLMLSHCSVSITLMPAVSLPSPQLISTFINNLNEEIRFRKLTLSQYRDSISTKLSILLDSFGKDQSDLANKAQNELNVYLNKFKQQYSDSLESLQKQKDTIEELNKAAIQRPTGIDDSLEMFMKFYNESVSSKLNQRSKLWDSFQSKFNDFTSPDPFPKQMDALSKSLKDNWSLVKQTASDYSINAETAVSSTLNDFTKFQDELASNAKLIAKVSQESIEKTLDKKNLRLERLELEKQLKTLEKQGSQWIDEKKKEFEITFKNLQDKVHITNSVYEELIIKRRASMQYSALNDQTLNKILKLIDPKTRSQQGWKLIKSENGYEVHRKFMNPGLPGSQFACVMCHGIINSAPEDVLNLFEDDSRVPEYNSFYADGKDLEIVADGTKVVWTGSPPVFPFKARDFCTVVHIRKLKDGTFVILNRAIKHPRAPPRPDYVRASIILAGNIIQPISGQPKKCKLTMLTQVDPGGVIPPWVINHICTLGPIGFLQNVETASKNRKRKNKKPRLIMKT